MSRHPDLHGAFKRVITSVIQSLSNYEPSQCTESVSLMFREIYIRVTSSCSDVMLRSGAPHEAPFLELGRLSSDFSVWKQHGRTEKLLLRAFQRLQHPSETIQRLDDTKFQITFQRQFSNFVLKCSNSPT